MEHKLLVHRFADGPMPDTMDPVRWGRSFLLVALLGPAAALLALGMDAAASGDVGPGKVAVGARFGSARTELQLPPLGQISAKTHWSPLTLEARVDEVDVDRVQALLSKDEPEATLRREIAADLEPLLRSFALRAILASAAVGGLVGALMRHRRFTHAAVGAVSAAVVVALLLGGAWRGYDADSFEEARFEGPLERAPAILATVKRHVDGLEGVRQRMEVLGGQMAELYSLTGDQSVTTAPDDEVRILHVSDIHSNPLGLEVTRQLADRFAVDAVLDTGDVTSFGLPVEAQLGELIGQMPTRYLLVPGNHDSASNRAAIDEAGNVEVLDGIVADVKGVRILGIADPTFTATNVTDSTEAAIIKRAERPLVADEVVAAAPDVLAVHDPIQAQGSYGKVPLVVAGHIHKRTQTRHGSTLVLTVGSTGATGLGTFLVDNSKSYEAEVLRFVNRRLVSVDRIAFDGVEGSFRVERRQIAPFDEPPLIAGPGSEGTPNP